MTRVGTALNLGEKTKIYPQSAEVLPKRKTHVQGVQNHCFGPLKYAVIQQLG